MRKKKEATQQTEPKKEKKQKKKKAEIIKTCLDILPIRSYNERLAAFRLADGSYMDVLQIIPRDMENMDEDDLQMEIFRLMKIFKTVGCDLKFVSMKFPLDLTQQKALLRRHKERLQDEARQRWLDRQYRELELAEQNVSSLHFYLVLFGRNEEELGKHREAVHTYAGTGPQRLVAETGAEQKKQIVTKLNNMNTRVDLTGEEVWQYAENEE